MSTLSNYTKVAADPLKKAMLIGWGALLTTLVLVTIAWAFNAFAGWHWPAGVLGFVGAIVMGFTILRPTFLLQSIPLGGFFAFLEDKDKTQGMATGPKWLYRIALVSIYCYTVVMFSLMTWSFAESPSMFWVVFMGVFILLMATEVHRGLTATWAPWIITGYVTLCIVGALWMTFNGSWRGDAFDKCTGEPLFLVDPTTGNVHGKRQASDCDNPLFSPETGEPLVPMGAEQAIRRNPATAPRSIASDAAGAVSDALGLDVPECRDTIPTVIHRTRLTVPIGCEMPVDMTRLVDGNWEIEFANENLPIVNGERQLNGHPIQDFISYSWANTGAGRNGMKILTNDVAFREAGVQYVEITFLPKGETGRAGAAPIDLRPEQ